MPRCVTYHAPFPVLCDKKNPAVTTIKNIYRKYSCSLLERQRKCDNVVTTVIRVLIGPVAARTHNFFPRNHRQRQQSVSTTSKRYLNFCKTYDSIVICLLTVFIRYFRFCFPYVRSASSNYIFLLFCNLVHYQFLLCFCNDGSKQFFVEQNVSN